MNKAKSLLLLFMRIGWLKYAVVLVCAITFVGFVGENSWYRHLKNRRSINLLEDEISALRLQYVNDSITLRQMDSDPRAIEKIARERYFMKYDDEDIFVLNTDLEKTTKTNDETAD